MRNRGLLYVGVLLVAFGIVFLIAQTAEVLLAPGEGHHGWRVMWPFLVLLVGLAFWLPLLIWWDRRRELAGLAVPAAIVTTNGLILLYQNLAGDWESWSYLWTMEPIAVAAGLLVIYLLSNQARGVLVAAGILGGYWAALLPDFLLGLRRVAGAGGAGCAHSGGDTDRY